MSGTIFFGFSAAFMIFFVFPLIGRRLSAISMARKCIDAGAIVLTYDDGPSETLTMLILSELDTLGVRATFFPVGSQAQRRPEILNAVKESGHEFGVHSQAHLHSWRVCPLRSTRDALAGFEALARWAGPVATFRPPYGKIHLLTWLALWRRGIPVAWWTVDSGDTWGEIPRPESVVERIISDGGGVILLHDADRGEQHAQFVLSLTRAVVKSAREAGISVLTLGELRDSTRRISHGC